MIGILLAAGFSRRFGAADKLLHPLSDGRPIGLVAAQNLINVLPTSIAVLRPENKALATLILNAGLHVVFCTENDQQMADSIAVAMRFSAHFAEAADGFVIALADMPYISAETIAEVSNTLASGASIAIPVYQSQRGHPVGFSAKFRSALENLQGDEGARSIIKSHTHEVSLLPTNDAGILRDIDTTQDL